ncbi:hypothetical protein [Sporosarcina psychrophila]|uniref:hypothetical protein n=1 Tax=Sporosarcina psychrophila TaxID=1476 RepID=UPI00078C8EB5|nr:hypothetical protein [Sporosarcina psychrophila]AMQ07536.1 hypothetical protein AZE41_17225 [Sporosarcina psychrophila]
MNYEVLFSESAQKVYIALLSVIVTQAINIIVNNRKTKKESKRKKFESFYHEATHEIYNLFKTMNAFRTDVLLINPYEYKDKLMDFIEDNKKSLEEKTFKTYQELKEVLLFEDNLGYKQDILEVKLFSEIMDDYHKLYKPNKESYKFLCLIHIWRITLMINNINYSICRDVLMYYHEFYEKNITNKTYKGFKKIKNIEQRHKFKELLAHLKVPSLDSKVIDNIVNVPDEYHYYEDSMAIGKMHLLETYEQDNNLSIEGRQTFRKLIIEQLYLLHHGSSSYYEDHFNNSEYMSIELRIALDYLVEKSLVKYGTEQDCYKITADGIDQYESNQ